MKIIIYVFSGFFILMALAVIFAYFRSRHYGLFLIGLTYGGSAMLALKLMHWWPLVAGFVLAWGMKMMGLEPPVVGEDSKSGDQGSVDR